MYTYIYIYTYNTDIGVFMSKYRYRMSFISTCRELADLGRRKHVRPINETWHVC